jgi:pyridoxamine 5'-phosphate oxidase family protein
MFTNGELEYLQANRLGRLSTVGPDGQPHAVAVGYHYDPDTNTIQIGSREDSSATKKFRDAARNPRVAFLVDDMASLDPPMPRGIEIRGRAEALAEGGERLGPLIWGVDFKPAWIRIMPSRIISWGIDPPLDATNSRSV